MLIVHRPHIENEGIKVQGFLALEIPENLEVALQKPTAPSELWRKLDLRGVVAIVAPACVQIQTSICEALKRNQIQWEA